MITKTYAELPAEYGCRQCGKSKPIAEMMLVHRKRTHDFLLRPRCKDCNNAREKGHRRAYKTKYLRLWRKRNAALNQSYWRQSQSANREALTARARMRWLQNHHAILIQARLRRQAKMKVTLAEAKELLRRHGCCYPTRYGLTPRGLRECERIRARQRRIQPKPRHPLRPIEIRMMVYEEGGNLRIKPRLQKPPYQYAAHTLARWQEKQKQVRKKAA